MSFISLVPPIYYNVLQCGALVDGSTDDTAALAAAMSAANNAGGGTVFVPGGTLIAQTITLYSNVHLIGAGIEATIIKLKNATNADLLSASTGSIGLSGSFGSGSAGGIHNWSIQNLTLDGNKANQSSGTSYPIRVYGYGYILQNLRVRNGYSGGILCDWNGGSTSPGQDNVEAQWANVKVHDNNAIGIQTGGPHDTQWSNVISYANGTHNIHIAPNARSIKASNCRSYNPATGVSAVCWLVEADGCNFSNCEGSGSDTCQAAIIASKFSWVGGSIYANPAGNVVGMQLGQLSGNTPFSGQINQSTGTTTYITCSYSLINTIFIECRSGAIDFENETNNTVIANIFQTAGTALKSNNYPAYADNIFWNVRGLTSDHSLNTTGQFSMQSSNSEAFVFRNGSGQDVFGLDGNGGVLSMVNGAQMYGYSDGYITNTFSFNADGAGSFMTKGSMQVGGASTFFSGSGAPNNANGNDGDYYFRSGTPGTANQRIYVKSAGAWVGVV